MTKREQVKEIVDSMLDYFDADSFDDLDNSMLGDLVTELEDCLEIELPLQILDEELTRKQFIDVVLQVYEDSL